MALTSRAFADLITFTRASSGTYFDSSGVMQTATTDVPRFNYEYNGSSWVAKGLRIEPAATNLLVRSKEFDHASWSKQQATISANQITAPDGTTTADKFVEAAALGAHGMFQTANKSAVDLTRTASVYAKAGERTKFLFRFTNQNGSHYAAATFDLSAGTVGAVSYLGTDVSSASASIRSVGNGWYRCSVTATFAAAVTGTAFYPFLADASGASSYAGDGSSGLYMWAAQIEDGSVATSFIETTTATATRVADVPPITGTNFSSWFNPTEGTFVVEFTSVSGAIPVPRVILAFDGNANKLLFYIGSGGTQVGTYDGSSIVTATGSIGAGTMKSAMSYNSSGRSVVSNGGTVATGSAPAAGFTTATTLNIGGTAGLGIVNGHIARITYYPTRLSNAQLQSLTA